MKNNKQNAHEKVKELVLARIKTMPSNMELSIGENYFSKDELIFHVKNEDNIGEQIMEIQLEFLQDLATGNVYGSV